MTFPLAAFANGDYVTGPILNRVPAKLYDTTLGADTASITFSSIPGGYRHLLLQTYTRSTNAVAAVGLWIRFNGDTTSSYTYQLAVAQATTITVTSSSGSYTNVIQIGSCPGSTAGANLFAVTTAVIADYANPTRFKTVTSGGAGKTGTASGNLWADLSGNAWKNLAAVTSIDILPSAGSLRAGSRALLIGVP